MTGKKKGIKSKFLEVPIGKFAGHQLDEVIEYDILYFKWLAEKSSTKQKEKYKDFFEYLELRLTQSSLKYDDSDLIMPFGRYEGFHVTSFIDDKSYCLWLLEESSLKEECPNIYSKLVALYKKEYLDDVHVFFYTVHFKNQNFFKLGMTADFIVKRMYSLHYGFSIYQNENMDIQNSVVYKTNFLNVEMKVKEHLKEWRIGRTEKFLLPGLEKIQEVFQDILGNYDKYYIQKQRLELFMPFLDGQDFKNRFVLKINQFVDFRDQYESFLFENGLIEKYNPEFNPLK